MKGVTFRDSDTQTQSPRDAVAGLRAQSETVKPSGDGLHHTTSGLRRYCGLFYVYRSSEHLAKERGLNSVGRCGARPPHPPTHPPAHLPARRCPPPRSLKNRYFSTPDLAQLDVGGAADDGDADREKKIQVRTPVWGAGGPGLADW